MQALSPVLIVVGVAAAAASAFSLRGVENAMPTSSAIIVVSSTAGVSATPLTLTDLRLPATTATCDAPSGGRCSRIIDIDHRKRVAATLKAQIP